MESKVYLYKVYLSKVIIGGVVAIQSFSDIATQNFFVSECVNIKLGWAVIHKIARRKLNMLHYAKNLADMAVPPGNHLEPLRGDLEGYYSVRINKKWRIIFKWTESGPAEVRISDYH